MTEWKEQCQSVVLCEGYHDRAFWQGWLLKRMGCVDPGDGTNGRRNAVFDPWNDKVTGGHFGYRSGSGKFVRVIPCMGRDNIVPEARRLVSARRAKPVTTLVICVDSDVDVEALPGAKVILGSLDVLSVSREFDHGASLAHGTVTMDGGATNVMLVRWECDDPRTEGVPTKQTLERLVSAAIVAAYPDRGPCVEAWLASRPSPPPATPKANAWSYMAGWRPDDGCERFFSALWEDEAIAAQLEARLRKSGAWAAAEAVAG